MLSFFDPTDKLGADVPNPKSHVAYGFATHVVILDDDGRVKEVYAAHDSGKVVNPISIQGQIEGGVLMGLGYALTEDFPLKDGVPQARYGTLGTDALYPDSGYPCDLCGERRTAAFRVRGKRDWGNCHDTYGSGGAGSLLRYGPCAADETSHGEHILLEQAEGGQIGNGGLGYESGSCDCRGGYSGRLSRI